MVHVSSKKFGNSSADKTSITVFVKTRRWNQL